MRRLLLVVSSSLALLLVLALPAGAESQTVEGTGDIQKMRVVNARRAVTVKLFGIGEPCDEARDFTIRVRWGKSQAYEVQAGCYGGTTWAEDLYFLSDRDDPNSAQAVDCPRFKVTYNEDKGFHRAFMPRACLDEASNKVRVEAFGVNYASATGGEAGPTRLLRRG